MTAFLNYHSQVPHKNVYGPSQSQKRVNDVRVTKLQFCPSLAIFLKGQANMNFFFKWQKSDKSG